jgi:hypothetical protein
MQLGAKFLRCPLDALDGSNQISRFKGLDHVYFEPSKASKGHLRSYMLVVKLITTYKF